MIRKTCRAFGLRVLVAAGLLLSNALGAATFDILVDKDNNTGTGCTVATAAGPFAGVEFIVTTTVDTGVYPPVVTGVARRDCASPPGTFGPSVAIDAGGWPVGIGTGAAGYDVLETYFPVSSPYGQYRMGFVYSDPNTGSDAVVTTNGQAGGSAIFFELGPFPVIPTLAHGTLLLLAFALAWFALRRLRQHKVSTLVFCGVLASIVAGTTWAAIVLNGLIDDWAGVPVLASDPTGDAPGGADMSAIYAKLEVVKMFVRADVKTASPPSFTSGNATTFTVGSPGNFPITTFGIPAVNSITQGGTLPGGVNFVYTAGQSTASLAGTPNAGTGGIYPLTFTAVNGVPPPAVQNFTLTVNQAPAITSAGATTFIVGTPGTFTVTSTGFPVAALTLTGCSPALPGGLTFTDNGNGTATLAGSAALGSVGTKNCTLTASNGVGAPVPLPFALTIDKAPTTTTVVSDINPSLIGQTVTFTATVTATPPGSGTPTGLVQFKDAGNPIGAPVALVGGTASYSTTALILGAHPITADYLGDGDFVVSAGALPTQTVNKAETTTTVVSSTNPSLFGQPVTFTATVAANPPGSGTPTGSVQFMDGASPLGAPVPLVGGTAALTTAALSTGGHAIGANYAGDANFNTSSGTLPTQTVNKAGTTTTLAAAPNPSVFGQNVTLTATVAATAPGAGLPTGTVNFFDGITPIGSGVLDAGGVATLTTAALAVNAHMVSAQYAGDTNFNTSTSNTVGQTVNKAGTTTGVVSDVNPSVFSQAVTFTATVTPVAPGAGTPAGTVTFKDGMTVLCNAVALSGATAICTTSALAAGGHAISVDYSGDGNFNLSSSGVLMQTVNAATTTTVLNAGSPTVFGQSATLTATVSVGPPGTAVPTGTVDFLDGMTLLGSGTLDAAGIATFSTTTLAVGPHVLNAQYVGNASFSASSGSAGKTVGAAATTTALGSSSNPALAGSSVTFTATVAAVAPGSGIPTGNVMFLDGAVPLGAVSLNALGQAALSTVALTPGVHGITATYGGVPEYSGSTSASLSQVITLAPSFTSAAGTTFLVGAPGTFAITATGFPAPILSAGACTPLLPAGVSFTGSGTTAMSIDGTPPVGSGGAYTCALTAANGVGSDAGQSFVLSIAEGPTAVDDPQYTVLNGETLTTTGGQLPPLASQARPEKLSPALPPEPGLVANDVLGFPAATIVSFGGGSLGGAVIDNAAGATVPFGPGHVLQVNADGSFTFTAAAGSYGNVTFLYRIQNGTGFSDATVTIGVHKAPLITSAATTAFLPGSPGTFTVTTSGFPLPALSIDAFTPAAAWLSFTDNGNGTATLAGTPPAMATGSITFAITAHNIIAPDAIQNFTLQLQSPPAFSSPNALTCVVGTPCPAFTVAASGVPTPTLSEVGTLPSGVTFTPATGALAGTPAAGTGGVYNISFGAANGVLPDATQPFTLTINEAPGTPAGPTPVTFVVGTPASFNYTAAPGYPAPTFSLVNCATLPAAITISGTGTLGGTAVAGTGGDYNCEVQAANGIGTPATLPIVVQVRQAPAITSANNATFQTAVFGTFTVTTTGFPTGASMVISEVGALPGAAAPGGGTASGGRRVASKLVAVGVTFVNNNDGTATISGVPSAGTGGTYTITITASNGIAPNANQTFTLTVNQPPAITSAASTVFTEGVAGTFTVTTTGFPTNAAMAITQLGSLPPGSVTFVNNNNGTATLAGTPGLGSAGLYALTMGAANGVSPAASQPFSLRVCPVLALNDLPQPTRTNVYAATVSASGGAAPYTYAVTAGSLASTALSSGGVFSGTVTASGAYSFTVTATDANGCAASRVYTGTINEPPAAGTDTYHAVGNTLFVVHPSVDAGAGSPHLYLAHGGLLANDSDGNGGAAGVGVTATAGTFATANGGTITIDGTGAFTYVPPAGFTGTDSYLYTVSDGVGTNTGTVNLVVGTRIWYVKNNVGLSGNGTSGSPFKTLAEAGGASAGNDTLYLFAGDGGTTGQNAGIILQAGQWLIGQGTALTAVGTFNAVVNPLLMAAGSAPTLGNSGGHGITLATGNTVRGLTVGATTGAKIFGSAFGTLTVGNSTTPDVALIGAGKALDLTNGTFAGTSAFSSVASTGSGTQGLSLSAVGGTVSFGSTTISGNNTQGILLSGSTATIDFGNTTVSNGTDGVSLQNNSSGLRTFGTLSISGVSATGFLHAVGGGSTNVAGATTITNPGGPGIDIRSSTTAVTFAATTVSKIAAGTGVNLGGAGTGNSGAVTFASLGITTGNGAGLLGAENSGTITVTTATGSISATGGPAIDITKPSTATPLALAFATVSSSGSPSSGINLLRVSGSLTATGGALASASGATFKVGTSTASVTYPGTITQGTAGQRVVDIQNNTGGTITLSGGVTSSGGTGTGVILNANTGATINFQGGLNLVTNTNAAFTATGGGTLNVCDENPCNAAATGALVNTITTTTGTALNVTNTTIGANGLEFQSIAANGAAKGIILNSTGTGPFKVVGTGTTAGSGGTIQATTTRGAEFVSASNITMKNMNFTNNAQSVQDTPATCANLGAGTNLNCSASIHMASVTGIALDNVDVNGSSQVCVNGNNVTTFSMTNGSKVRNCGTETSENGMQFANLLGTSTITGATFTNNWNSALDVVNTSGAGTLNITSAAFTGNGVGTHGSTLLKYSGDGTAIMTINVQSSSFNGSNSYGYFTDTAATSFVTSTINNSTFGTVSANALGIQYINSASSDIAFNVTNNTLVGGNTANGTIMMVGFSETGTTTGAASLSGTFSGNTIGTNGVAGSGCANGCGGVGIFPAGAGAMNLSILNNVIRQVSSLGISLSSNAGTTGTLTTRIKGNTLDQPQPGFAAFLRAISLTPGNSGGASPTSCFEVGGAGGGDKNTIGAGWLAGSMVRINNANDTGTTRLPGYLGTNMNETDMETFVAGNNTGLAVADTFVSAGTVGITGGAACP